MLPGRENFEQLYMNYYSALCHFAKGIVGSSEEAEDVVEDVFLKIYQNNRTFDPNDNIVSYLYTATRNESLTHLTRNNRIKERQWHYNFQLPENEQSHVNAMIQSEVLRAVLAEINTLPGRSGEVIKLSYFDGLRNADIAKLLDLSEQTVKNLKSKGIAALKTKLSPDIFILFCFLYDFR